MQRVEKIESNLVESGHTNISHQPLHQMIRNLMQNKEYNIN